MLELTVSEYLCKNRIECEDSIIYVVRDDRRVYYVGKSEGQSGVVGRLDNHFWLQRRGIGNYIMVGVSESDVDVLSKLENHLKGKPTYRDGFVKLNVWTSGIKILQELAKANRVKWLTNDPLGKYVLERLPESGRWKIQFYTFDDCQPVIKQYIERTGTPLVRNVRNAEMAMIQLLHPRLNTIHR